MSKGAIQNRDSFLSSIASSLGREVNTSNVEKPLWKKNPQSNVLKGFTQDQLVDVLRDQCKNIHTKIVETTSDHITHTVEQVLQELQSKTVVSTNDDRLHKVGVTSFIEKNYDSHVWNVDAGDENIRISEKADVGITYSDYTLAESATVVLVSDHGKGRSVSLLPENYICIVPKSTIVPRMSQVAQKIHERVEDGKPVASCINFISGPSNSADIEMNLIVGVHGPVRATYIVVNDL